MKERSQGLTADAVQWLAACSPYPHGALPSAAADTALAEISVIAVEVAFPHLDVNCFQHFLVQVSWLFI